jgi:predicted dehydrogenase
MRSACSARIHRLGRKVSPPAGTLSCGLIGAGSFFNYAYLPALNRENSAISIAGVLTRNLQTAREAQRGLRYTTQVFDSFAALKDSGVNSVLILAPNHLHFDFARKAIESGLNVFCEKPLASNVGEALALKAMAAKAGKVLMVDFNQRFLDRNCVLKNVIAENRVGKIASVHAYHNQNLAGRFQSYEKLNKAITGGGVVHNAGIHFINLFLHWFGEAKRVNALFENRALPKDCGEDTAFCRFWFRNGVTATLEASLANAVSASYERVQFIGETGEISSDLKKGDIRCRMGEKQWLKIPCKTEVISDSVFNALQSFERCVTTGMQPETDVDDFVQTMKVVEALTLSAQRGEDVHLDELERKYAG